MNFTIWLENNTEQINNIVDAIIKHLNKKKDMYNFTIDKNLSDYLVSYIYDNSSSKYI